MTFRDGNNGEQLSHLWRVGLLGLLLFEHRECRLERVREFLGVITEDDDAVFALRLDLRDGQVFLVVLGDPHVDEVSPGPRVDV